VQWRQQRVCFERRRAHPRADRTLECIETFVDSAKLCKNARANERGAGSPGMDAIRHVEHE
jgi:hypothetical protein